MKTPRFRVLLDGTDLTAKIQPRLVSLTLTETRGDEADQLDIVLDDSDGRLAIPRKGAVLALWMGWADTGLVDKGTFEVDEIEHSGAPDQLTLRGRSAPMTADMRTRRERSWHGKTVGDIVRTIATEHDLLPRVGDFAGTVIDHIDQTGESDLAFLNRLGKRFDAVATVKKNALLFLPISQTVNSSGQALPVITLDRKNGDSHRYHVAGRDAYSGVRAYWQDTNGADRKSVLVGKSGNAKRLRDTYGNETEAREAAQAEWNRIQRGAAKLTYTLAYGRPDITPQMGVRFPDMKEPMGSAEWLVAKVTHTVRGSYTTALELETKGSASNNSNENG